MQSLWELDQSLFRAIHLGWHQSWLDPVFWLFSYSGLGQVQALFILALLPWTRTWRETPAGFFRIFQTPLRLKRSDWRGLSGPLLLALTLASIVNTGILKNVVERQRPSNLTWALPQEPHLYNAFPSGHTATSFAIATMVALMTAKRTPVWGIIAFLWATGVGISRIYRGVHWPTDVLGGALVGVATACLAYMLLSRTDEVAIHEPDKAGSES